MDTPTLGQTRITPVAYRLTGYSEVTEGDQDFYSVTIYERAKGLGVGWHPKYNFKDADAYGHMYREKARAEFEANNFT